MAYTMPDDVLEIAKPALQKRVEQLIDEAFKLAQYAKCSEMLEGVIDACSSKYFGEGIPQYGSQQEGQESGDEQAPAFQRVGRNIVVRDAPGAAPMKVVDPVPGRNANRVAVQPGQRCYAPSARPGNLVPASKYSSIGRPVSKYQGVSYSGCVREPWLVRCGNERVGRYSDEETAARAYDEALARRGKLPANFPAGH